MNKEIQPKPRKLKFGGSLALAALILAGGGTACGKDKDILTPTPTSTPIHSTLTLNVDKVVLNFREVATATPRPTETAVPTKTPEPTATPKQPEYNRPATTSRPLPINQWTIVRRGEIVAGDVDTGSVKYDNNKNTGMVSGPFDQDMLVLGPWGGNIIKSDEPKEAIRIRNEIAKEMLRSGCGTGYGCPEGVVITDGIRIINVIRPE